MTTHLLTAAIVIVGIACLGCERPPRGKTTVPENTAETTHPTTVVDDPQIQQLLVNYFAEPDDTRFDEIVAAGRDSQKPRLTIFWNFNEHCRLMNPVDDPSVDKVALHQRAESYSSSEFLLLADTMLVHPNPGRRWRMAEYLGYFAGQESIPALKKLLEDKEDFVRDKAKMALSRIETRTSASSGACGINSRADVVV